MNKKRCDSSLIRLWLLYSTSFWLKISHLYKQLWWSVLTLESWLRLVAKRAKNFAEITKKINWNMNFKIQRFLKNMQSSNRETPKAWDRKTTNMTKIINLQHKPEIPKLKPKFYHHFCALTAIIRIAKGSPISCKREVFQK